MNYMRSGPHGRMAKMLEEHKLSTKAHSLEEEAHMFRAQLRDTIQVQDIINVVKKTGTKKIGYS